MNETEDTGYCQELVCRGHSADREAGDKQGEQAVDEKRLAAVAIPHVTPDEWEHEDRRDAIEIMNGRSRAAAAEVHGDTREHLNDHEQLANDKRAGQASGQRSTPDKAQQSPGAHHGHIEQHGSCQAIVN